MPTGTARNVEAGARRLGASEMGVHGGFSVNGLPQSCMTGSTASLRFRYDAPTLNPTAFMLQSGRRNQALLRYPLYGLRELKLALYFGRGS